MKLLPEVDMFETLKSILRPDFTLLIIINYHMNSDTIQWQIIAKAQFPWQRIGQLLLSHSDQFGSNRF